MANSGWIPTTYLGVPKPVTGRPDVDAVLARVERPHDLRQAGRELRSMGLGRDETWDLLQAVVDGRLGGKYRHEDLAGAMWDGCGLADPIFQAGGANPTGARGHRGDPWSPDRPEAGFPWRGGDPVGIEPPLGYRVDEVPPNCGGAGWSRGGAGWSVIAGEHIDESVAPSTGIEISAEDGGRGER